MVPYAKEIKTFYTQSLENWGMDCPDLIVSLNLIFLFSNNQNTIFKAKYVDQNFNNNSASAWQHETCLKSPLYYKQQLSLSSNDVQSQGTFCLN